MDRSCIFIYIYAVWMGGAGGVGGGDGLLMVSRVSLYAIWMGGAGMDCQWLAGFVYDNGEIVIGSSDKSGGVVVGARVWNGM